MIALTVILVLWEAPNAGDMAIAMAEPVEGLPAAQCEAMAAEYNKEGNMPEGEEPNP